MAPSFTDDDVGKTVEKADGTALGRVTTIEEDGTARVEPDPDIVETLKARLGWSDIGESFLLEADSVFEITDTRIRLEEGISDPQDRPQPKGSDDSTRTDISDERTESAVERDPDTGSS
ncbi:hypothetical protein [Halopiger djelfimassiliensis]|uniref:hypothetical protein n=1 Tax=Halopiger djelfimassiliensis TaxID=1293047 RepID=UPI000677C78B|nr:hypothetical protein [Halopiger djelfimassiliensis]